MAKFKRNLYLQIVADVKRRIELGLMQADEKLPSCRDLAMKMGINPNTVQRAYSTLEEEGYIYTMPKKGVYVSADREGGNAEGAVREKVAEFKEAGISSFTLKKIIEEVYGEEL